MTDENLPPITQQAVNFAKDTIAHAANGFKKVDAKTKGDRIAICRSCPHFRPQGERCGKCGCYIHSKTSRASSSCPIGLWGVSFDTN